MDKRAFDDAFGPPKPLTDDQVRRLTQVQRHFQSLATNLMEFVPATPDRERALNLLREAKLASEAAVRFGRSIFTREVIADLMAPFEEQDKRVAALWINAHELADILKYSSDIFDAVHERAVLQTGLYGVLWNMKIYVSRKIPVGMAKVVTDDDGDWRMPEGGPSESELVRIH